MSHFYGTLLGTRSPATRCGNKVSGLTVQAASWGGAIQTHVWHDAVCDVDRFEIHHVPWHGEGISKIIASGIVGRELLDS
jgi:hypothetical protein